MFSPICRGKSTLRATYYKEHFQKALAIRKELIASDPSNSQFQRDVNVSYNKLGDLSLRLNETKLAKDHFLKALKVAEKLSALDPENASYQRDLAVSHAKLGSVYETLGGHERKAAITHYQKVVELFSDMEANGTLSPGDQEFISAYREKAERLQRSQ